MLELINMIPAWLGGVMVGIGVAAAILVLIAIGWAKSWSQYESYWREWTTFGFFVLVAVLGFISLVI